MNINTSSYSEVALPHLQQILHSNQPRMEDIARRLITDVLNKKSLFVFGSGHSGLFPLELYHRAGGASFLIPIVADYLLPTAGPPVVRLLERTPGVASSLLLRAQPQAGEMIWIASQSGVNPAVVDVALDAKKLGLYTVAFTSINHSSAVASRHQSGKKLFEVCDTVIDLGGKKGDAAVDISPSSSNKIFAGPLSTLSTICLGHSILVAACAAIEAQGVRCTYTSVNTPEGELRNQSIEKTAAHRDPLLRG